MPGGPDAQAVEAETEPDLDVAGYPHDSRWWPGDAVMA
jgi:hypothetical protein